MMTVRCFLLLARWHAAGFADELFDLHHVIGGNLVLFAAGLDHSEIHHHSGTPAGPSAIALCGAMARSHGLSGPGRCPAGPRAAVLRQNQNTHRFPGACSRWGLSSRKAQGVKAKAAAEAPKSAARVPVAEADFGVRPDQI